MSQNAETLARAWRDAGEDLKVTVVAPYELVDKTGNVAAVAVAWVESFGSAQGIVIAGLNSHQETVRAAVQAQGKAWSFINEESYAQYDRDLFMATLNGWGWHGQPAKVPNWYTGKRWTE